MADEAINIFSQIPDTYGGTAVMDPPVKAAPEEPAAPAAEESTPAPDLLKPTQSEENKPVEKTPAQYAAERREAKAKRNELLEKAPVLEEENARLKAQFESSQKRLAELEAMSTAERNEAAVTEDDIETLKSRVKIAEGRYISANAPSFDPYQDEEVKRYATAVDDALRANLPKFAATLDGQKTRINLDVIRKTQPERKAAMDQAVMQYAMAAESGDTAGLDKAVMLMGTALGNLDMDDDDVKVSLDAALSAAADPFYKGMHRFKHVQENAVNIIQERRAEEIKQTEARLMAPLRLDPAMVDKVLEEDPSHAWGNFGKLLADMPDDFRSKLEEEVRLDSSVLGSMKFMPPPLAPGANSDDIAKHEALVMSGQQRAVEAAQYLAVGRAMIDGGLLAHLRAKALEAQERMEEGAASTTIPNRGGKTSNESSKTNGMWDNVPSSYGGGR
jgi:hypothetical protein